MKLFNRYPVVFFAIIFLCGLICIAPAFGQLSAGVEGGYTKNYLVTNNANRAFTNYQPRGGFDVGIVFQYKISDWFAVAADPSFVQKNYSQQRSAFFAGVYQDNYNSYIQLPVMGHFMFGGSRLKGFLNVGIYGGYWQAGTVKGQMPSYSILRPTKPAAIQFMIMSTPITTTRNTVLIAVKITASMLDGQVASA